MSKGAKGIAYTWYDSDIKQVWNIYRFDTYKTKMTMIVLGTSTRVLARIAITRVLIRVFVSISTCNNLRNLMFLVIEIET